MVENISLMKEISKYKNDHINFKKNYFKNLDSFESCKVIDCKVKKQNAKESNQPSSLS